MILWIRALLRLQQLMTTHLNWYSVTESAGVMTAKKFSTLGFSKNWKIWNTLDRPKSWTAPSYGHTSKTFAPILYIWIPPALRDQSCFTTCGLSLNDFFCFTQRLQQFCVCLKTQFENRFLNVQSVFSFQNFPASSCYPVKLPFFRFLTSHQFEGKTSASNIRRISVSVHRKSPGRGGSCDG